MATEIKAVSDIIGRCPPLNLVTYPEFCIWVWATLDPSLGLMIAKHFSEEFVARDKTAEHYV